MAPSPTSSRLSEAHRIAQARLGVETVRLMVAAWPLLDLANLDETIERWLRVARPVVRRQRRRSARLAAEYYRALRLIEAGDGDVTPVLADLIDDAEIDASLIVTGPDVVRRRQANRPLSEAARVARMGSAASGRRMAMNGGRQTVTQTVLVDEQAIGWARTGSGSPCAFCLMLISRGPVYRSEQTASFDAHDGACNCTARAIFATEAEWDRQAEDARELWASVQDEAAAEGELRRGTQNDALNALRRHLAAH